MVSVFILVYFRLSFPILDVPLSLSSINAILSSKLENDCDFNVKSVLEEVEQKRRLTPDIHFFNCLFWQSAKNGMIGDFKWVFFARFVLSNPNHLFLENYVDFASNVAYSQTSRLIWLRSITLSDEEYPSKAMHWLSVLRHDMAMKLNLRHWALRVVELQRAITLIVYESCCVCRFSMISNRIVTCWRFRRMQFSMWFGRWPKTALMEWESNGLHLHSRLVYFLLVGACSCSEFLIKPNCLMIHPTIKLSGD